MDLAGLDVHAAVAANLWPELSNTTEPSPAIARAVESGEPLRGETPSVVLRERRNRVLRGLPALRENG